MRSATRGSDVLPPVVDGVAAPVALGEPALVVVANAADDDGAAMREPLAEQQARAACGGVDQHGVARLHLATLVNQIFRRHALEHGGGGLLEADGVGQLDHGVRRDGAEPRIGAGRRARVGDAVAFLQPRHRAAHSLHDARALEADDPGEPRRGDEAAALIGIEEVEPDRLLGNPHLGGAGVRHPYVLDAQHLGTAGLVHPDGLGLDRQPGPGAVLLAVHRREDAGELALARVHGVERQGAGRSREDRRLNGCRRVHEARRLPWRA